MKFTYYGHSTFQIEIAGKKILFDPFITANPIAIAAGIKAEDIEADYILISHGHWDHTDDAIEIARRTGAKVVSNFEIYTWAQKNGVTNAHPMNVGGSFNFEFGNVKLTPAIHSSSFTDGSYAGSAVGFVISTDEGNIYYSGDTALFSDMKLIGEGSAISVAILPIGDNFTMGVTDAIKAAKFVGTQTVVGVHFDTFGYIKVDHKQAISTGAASGIKLILPEAGKSIEI